MPCVRVTMESMLHYVKNISSNITSIESLKDTARLNALSMNIKAACD